MIELRPPKKDEKPLASASGGAAINKAYVKSDDKWSRISVEDLMNVTVGQLWRGEVQVMWDVQYDKDQKIYITVTEEDRIAIRKKYPEAAVVCIKQFAGMLKGDLSNNAMVELFGKVLMVMTMSQDIKVTGVK